MLPLKGEKAEDSFAHLENFQHELEGKPIGYYINSRNFEEVTFAYGFMINLREGIRNKTIETKYTPVQKKLFRMWEVALRARYNYLIRTQEKKKLANVNYRARAKAAVKDAENKSLTLLTKSLVQELTKMQVQNTALKHKPNLFNQPDRVLDNESEHLVRQLIKKQEAGIPINQAIQSTAQELSMPQDSNVSWAALLDSLNMKTDERVNAVEKEEKEEGETKCENEPSGDV